MAAAAGSIISGVLQGTGGAGAQSAPQIANAIQGAQSSSVAPDVKRPEITTSEVTNAPQTNWQDLANQAQMMSGNGSQNIG